MHPGTLAGRSCLMNSGVIASGVCRKGSGVEWLGVSAVSGTKFKLWLCCLLVRSPWASSLNVPQFLLCKTGISISTSRVIVKLN